MKKRLVLSFGLLIHLSSGTALSQEEPQPTPEEVYEMAFRTLQRLGASVEGAREESCNSCHSLSLYTLRDWSRAAMMQQWRCLYVDEEDPMPALDRINCLRSDPTDPTSPFLPYDMGLLTAGAGDDLFQDLFKEAYPDDWERRFNEFTRAVAMPPSGGEGFSAAEFAELKSWIFDHYGQYLEQIVGKPEDPPRECVAETSDDLLTHVERMSFLGWEARNREDRPGSTNTAAFP